LPQNSGSVGAGWTTPHHNRKEREMKTLNKKSIAGAVAALWTAAATATAASAGVLPPVDPAPAMPPPPPLPANLKKPAQPIVAVPAEPKVRALESNTTPTANAGFASNSVFTASTPGASAPAGLVPPVTLSYAGNSSTLQITDSGTGKGLESVITNAINANSAVYGRTDGSGAGVQGANSGTTGVAGSFTLTNPDTVASALLASNAGDGPAIYGKVTKASTAFPAIYGQSTGTTAEGVGIEGNGNSMGVYGTSLAQFGTGVYGASPTGYGVSGYSNSGFGVEAFSWENLGAFIESNEDAGLLAAGGTAGAMGYSYSGYGVSAVSEVGTGLYANNVQNGHGITAHSGGGIAVYASSDTSYAIWGQSTNTMAVIGEDSGSGVGVYGSSATGYAGLFAGNVGATSFVTTSDKNAKAHFQPVDRQDILDRVSRLPITSWDFKTDSKRRHVGPMAQDFHAAFGLDGDDDTHINLTDMAGVSLAAIQELSHQMKLKDAQIAELKDQLSAQTKAMAEIKSTAAAFSARMTLLEQQRGATAQTVALAQSSGTAVAN
jgi:Chaperone of endosialidase